MTNEPRVKFEMRPGSYDPRGAVVLSDAERAKAFKGVCPNCKADIIAMSSMSPDIPTTIIEKGDALCCDQCGHHALVQAINPCNRLQLVQLPVRTFL